jgi:hypothetical protein
MVPPAIKPRRRVFSMPTVVPAFASVRTTIQLLR